MMNSKCSDIIIKVQGILKVFFIFALAKRLTGKRAEKGLGSQGLHEDVFHMHIHNT